MTDDLLKRLTRLQMRRPFVVLMVAALTVGAMGWLASRLSLITAFGELLPRNKESDIIAERLKKRLRAEGHVLIDPTDALIRRADEERLYYWLDIHLTPAGNRIVAEQALTVLRDFVPAPRR